MDVGGRVRTGWQGPLGVVDGQDVDHLRTAQPTRRLADVVQRAVLPATVPARTLGLGTPAGGVDALPATLLERVGGRLHDDVALRAAGSHHPGGTRADDA